MAEDHLLERHPQPEAQRARAQPADRARGELQDGDAAACADAHLRMNGTLGEAKRSCSVAGSALDRLEHRRRLTRRRDVDRLLEVGTVERIGLVEDGEYLEL